MAVTRREFLVASGVLAATAGCAKSVAGTPTADPAATRRPPGNTNPNDEPEELPDSVNIGIFVYPPYAISEGGDLTGPVPDVARAVLAKLDITEVKFTTLTEPEQLMVMLQAGRLDFGGGLGITADRCTSLRFTEPDHVSGTAFVVAKGNPKGLKVYADVVAKEARMAALPGAPETEEARDAGVPTDHVVPIDDPREALAAVSSGEIDCFAFDDLTLRHLVEENGDKLEVATPFMPSGRPPYAGAYAFSPDSDLFERFDDELRELHESGEWRRIVEPFGFTEEHEPPSDLTTEELCRVR